MRGVRDSYSEEMADLFLRGMPMTIETAQAYFLVKNYAQWPGNAIKLHAWDSWDNLADRLDQRFEQHIWYPSHWS